MIVHKSNISKTVPLVDKNFVHSLQDVHRPLGVPLQSMTIFDSILPGFRTHGTHPINIQEKLAVFLFSPFFFLDNLREVSLHFNFSDPTVH